MGDFCFDSKYVRVCEKHFDDSDIVRADEFVVNGEKVSLPRDKPLLKPCAIPRKFDGLPAYLTKPKQRSRTLTRRSPAKRRRELSSCARKTEVHAKPGTSGAASCDEGIHGDRKNPQTSFQHPCDPSREIYTVIDPPHIFKCIRNNLQKVVKFLLPEGDVYHDHFKSLLGYEEDQAGLRAVPKLTKAHIMPNAFQKMSVRLAVQACNIMTFSCAAAAALEIYSRQDVCKELHDSKATAAFTRRMNGLFDSLNSRRPEHVQYNEAEHIATLKENMTWLNNCCDYIESLPKQRQACFLTKPTSEALRVTLLSTIALVENLLASGFRYVLVENFGQDPLEVDSLAIFLDDVLLEPTESEEEALEDLSPKECILDYVPGYVAQIFSEMCCTHCVESLKGLQRSPSDLILVKSRGFFSGPLHQTAKPPPNC
ncbi:hypothetical protein HPB51_028547 [Rhipicephalus microplus]|uniref:Transposable element P transposase-like GTP-binding insertion domain-containing protein n=1 Tax=Rhipicephalus microplus TaxID=6941 RepID=A0A9J6CXA4_RHIMP|nr:hypothetical protein HPB51_028547 [Rhipicephalus microplus]